MQLNQKLLFSLYSFSDPAFDVSVKVSVEMPFEIRSLDSPTHAMKTKVILTHTLVEHCLNVYQKIHGTALAAINQLQS